MSHRLSNWIENQKQTRRFHPSWILLAVVVTIVVAAIVWIPAAVVTKAERYERLPAVGNTAVPAEEIPATSEPWTPTRAGPKTIRVHFSPADRDGHFRSSVGKQT